MSDGLCFTDGADEEIRWRPLDGEHVVQELLCGQDLFELLHAAVDRLEHHDEYEGCPQSITWSLDEGPDPNGPLEWQVLIAVAHGVHPSAMLPPDPDFSQPTKAASMLIEPCPN